jgi:hypothetical protein
MSLDLSSRQFVSEAEHGSLYVGSPETVARNGAGDDGVAVETVRLRPSARQPWLASRGRYLGWLARP